MKIALCLHGYIKNAEGNNAIKKSFEYIENKLIKKFNVDVFCHSWDISNQNTYENMYGKISKNAKFENQINFKDFDICKNQSWFDLGFDRQSTMYHSNIIERHLSFLYSRNEAIKMAINYSNENNFNYDSIIVGRFDLGTRGKSTPQKYYATNFNFFEKSDMSNIHFAFWDQFNHGLPDHWFYGDSSCIEKVGNLYDNIFKYYQIDSEYVENVTNGWFDSNSNNEFSNEMFKDRKDKSSNLVKWPKWHCIDNHKTYKWHLLKVNKMAFKTVDITKDY